jgi:CRP-like cAMP-binding protein
MKQMNFFAGEYLFTQREQAEEVYFIFKGKVKLMYDLTEGETDAPYLIPFNMYVEGSYFGDSDVLADTSNEGRDGYALVDAKSIIYVIVRKDLLQVLHSYLKEMRIIAKERRLHHKSAIDELKMQNMHVKKKLIKNYKH